MTHQSPIAAAPPAKIDFRWALAGLSLTMLMPSLDTSIANAALPALSASLSASFAQAQWIVLSYLIALTALLVTAGRLGDRFGRKRMLLSGIALFTLASLLCGLAPTLLTLVAARTLQGLGAALMMALAMAAVGEAVPKARTGSAMGLIGSMSAIGTTLGPSLGGFLLAGFGWRSLFLINLPIGALALLLLLRGLPEARQQPSPQTGAGRFALLRESGVAGALALTFLVATMIMSTLVVGPFYLARGLGLGVASVGLTLSAGPLVAALAGVPAGRAVDRFGTGRATVAALAGMALGLVALAWAPALLGVSGYVCAIALVTANYALFQTANNTFLIERAGERRGEMSGLTSLARNLGLIAGTGVMGAVFALACGEDAASAPADAVMSGAGATFTLAALLILSALALRQVRGRLPALPRRGR